VCSPIVLGFKLIKDENGSAIDAREYKQVVGSLMYLLATRPNLAYSVCLVARFMDRPTDLQVTAVKRIMRYLKGTLVDGIMYSHITVKANLLGWSDSDYARDLDDRKSTSGYVLMLGTGTISWSSKNQPIVTLSTTEAEHVTASLCACQGTIELKHCTSQEQLADIMTKPLKIDAFHKLKDDLGMKNALKC
ncbi:copia-type polyprotein, partial [Trifolium pratense]